MSRTKISGILLIVSAICLGAVDFLDGNGFNISPHLKSAIEALQVIFGGSGFYFLRSGVQTSEKKILEELENAKKEIRTQAQAKPS